MTIQSHEGERIENLLNTGPTTHGEVSVPVVTRAGISGAWPEAITRISSGVSAASARHPAARAAIAALPSLAIVGPGRRPATAA